MGSKCCKCAKKTHAARSSDGSGNRYRGDLPMPPDRFRIETRGNVVQLTLKQTRQDDAGHYSLIAKRISQDGRQDKFARRIHLSVDESSSYEEGDPPVFLRRLSDLNVKVGTRTRFLVEIRSSTSPKVYWHRNDEPVQTGSTSRFSFVHEGNFYCVDVAPVTVDDEGHWTCMVENLYGRSSCTSHLSVIVPKAYKKPEFVGELRALLTETGTVSLECKVVGIPTPLLKWFKDGKEIKAGDVFALTANPDDPTSLGTYTCEAVNCMGTAFSSSRVHVMGKGSREGSLRPADTMTPSGPLPVFKQILHDESCKIGESLLLSCKVQVPPWPKEITWYNTEGRVESDEKYRIMEDGLGGYSIQIDPVEAMDEGEWKCVASSTENVKQFTTCYVAMSIPKNYRKPRFMESLKAILTEEGLVSFECKVVGFPTPFLRWFKDGQELKPGDVYQLTGTNSLGSYCCIARNCMGETKSIAELTVEDIHNQLNDEERLQLVTTNQPPKFIRGLRSCEARINDNFKFSVQVNIVPEPSLSWYRDDSPLYDNDKYRIERETLGTCHLEVQRLEFVDQAEWKCVASNDFGHSVTSCFLKLIIPKHYKTPKFLESLRAILSEEGAVNLECKVIGVPQPVLKWYKDGTELKPGDIHRIISGQDGTCCLGTYTCEATNCMGSVRSSASLLGFEDRVSASTGVMNASLPLSTLDHDNELARNLSLSTIHEERTSQLHETPQTDQSVTLDDRGEVSFSFDGKEVSVSLYETPDLTEEEAIQIVEMYANQLSEKVTEHNVIELPPMRFMKETSTSGNLLMEAVVIDVSPDYFVTLEDGDDLRTEADVEDMSIVDDPANHTLSLSSSLPHESRVEISLIEEDRPPIKPPRRKSGSIASKSERSEKSDNKLQESESYHSAKEPLNGAISTKKKDDLDMDIDVNSEAFDDALLSACSRAENNSIEIQKDYFSGEKHGSSFETADLSFDSAVTSGAIKKRSTRMKRSLDEKGRSQEYTNEERKRIRRSESEESSAIEIEKSQTDDESEKSFLMSTRDIILNIFRQLSEPVLVIRDALVDFDSLLSLAEGSYEEQDAFISENFVFPLQNLCEQLSVIEIQTLKNAGKRSLAQNARIAILETIGGPTEELLRGIEIIKRRGSADILKTDPVILEPLVDPVDEILLGLTKIEYELSGSSRAQKPIILERMIRTISWLGQHVETADASSVMINPLKAIYKTLDSFVNKITLNPINGTWTENMDAVLVESLCRPLEDLARTSTDFFNDDTSINHDLAKRISEPFEELFTRLDALVVALEGYETDHRTEFVLALKSSLVRAAEELTLLTEEYIALEESRNLSEVILDPLIDVQSSINLTLRVIEEPRSEEEFKISQVLRSSELAMSLAEMRQTLSNVAHTATTLKEEETIEALTDLREPLFDLQLALSSECLLEEIPIINSIISPLNALKIIFSTAIRYVHGREVANSISPILQMLEEMQEQIPMVVEQLTLMESHAKEVSSDKEEPDRRKVLTEILETLEVANQLNTIFFDFSSVLEEQERSFGKSALSGSRLASRLLEVRESIGSATVALGNLPIKISLNDDDIINELAHLSGPLINLQKELNEKHNALEKQILKCVAKPISRLKMVIESLAKSIYRPEKVMLVLGLLGDIDGSINILENQAYGSEIQLETLDESQVKALHISEGDVLERAIQNGAKSELISGRSSKTHQEFEIVGENECDNQKFVELKKAYESEHLLSTDRAQVSEVPNILQMAKAEQSRNFQKADINADLIGKDISSAEENRVIPELINQPEVFSMEQIEELTILPGKVDKMEVFKENEEFTKYQDDNEKQHLSAEAKGHTIITAKDDLQAIGETISTIDLAKVTESTDVLKTGKCEHVKKFETVQSLETNKGKDNQLLSHKSFEEKTNAVALANKPNVLKISQVEEVTTLDKAAIISTKEDKIEVVRDEQQVIEGLIVTQKSQVLEPQKVLKMAKSEEAMDFEIAEVEKHLNVKDDLQEMSETSSMIEKAKITESPSVLNIEKTDEVEAFQKASSLETEKSKGLQGLLQQFSEKETKAVAELTNQPDILKMTLVEEASELDEAKVILGKTNQIEVNKEIQEAAAETPVAEAPAVFNIEEVKETSEFKEANTTAENKSEIRDISKKIPDSSLGKENMAVLVGTLELEEEATQIGRLNKNIDQQKELEEAKEIDMAQISEKPKVLQMGEIRQSAPLDDSTVDLDELEVDKNILKPNLQESKESGKIDITEQKVLKMGKVEETTLIEEVAGIKETSANEEDKTKVFETSSFLLAAEQVENFGDLIVETLKETKDITNLQLQESKEISNTECATVKDAPQVLHKEDVKEFVQMDQLTEFMDKSLVKEESGKATDIASTEGTVNVINAPAILQMADAEDVSILSEELSVMDGKNFDTTSLYEIFGESETEKSDKILQISKPSEVLKMAKVEECTSYEETSREGLEISEPMQTDASTEKISELLNRAISGEEIQFIEMADEVAAATGSKRSNIELSTESVQAELAKVFENPKVLALAGDEVMKGEELLSKTKTLEKCYNVIESNLQEVIESVEMGTVNINNRTDVLKMAEAVEPMDLNETTEIGETKDNFQMCAQRSTGENYLIENAVEKMQIVEIETPEKKVRNEAGSSEENKLVHKELLTKLVHALEELKQHITNIVEEFEQTSVTTPLLQVSQLAAAIEMLRRSVLQVHRHVSNHALKISDLSTESSLTEISRDKETLIAYLIEMLDPLTKVSEALSVTQEYRAPELRLLNRLNQPIHVIKQNIVNLVMESTSNELEGFSSYVAYSLEPMAQALETIENGIPLALSEVNSRQEIVSVLHNVLRPLEVVRERMNELDVSLERTLETDVANILVGPTNYFSRILGDLLKQCEASDHSEERIRDAVLNLHGLVEPLFEFHSSLSVIRSSRRSSVVETALLEERKNVTLRSVEGLNIALTEIIYEVGRKHRDGDKDLADTLLDSLITLNEAMSSVQRHVNKAEYSRGTSCIGTLQARISSSVDKLASIIDTVEYQLDQKTQDVISKPLETLRKQLQITDTQLHQTSDQPLDEEAIVEGFLYPANRLLFALNELNESQQNGIHQITDSSLKFLKSLGESVSEFESSLSSLHNELVNENVGDQLSTVETLRAVLVPLHSIRNAIICLIKGSKREMKILEPEILQTLEVCEQEENKIGNERKVNVKDFQQQQSKNSQQGVPTVLTTVETIIDECIEISRRQTECLTLVESAKAFPKTEVEENQQTVNIEQTATLQGEDSKPKEVKIKEDINEIEEMTALPLEELIEAIVEFPVKSGEEGDTDYLQIEPERKRPFVKSTSPDRELTEHFEAADRAPISIETAHLLPTSAEATQIERVDAYESVSPFQLDRKGSVIAFWSMVDGPLNALKESIVTIIDEQNNIEQAAEIGEEKSKHGMVLQTIVIQQLTELQESIAAIQQLTSAEADNSDEISWQEETLPALQNLARSLEELGENLPVIASQQFHLNDESTTVDISAENSVATTLRVLVKPLQEFRESLSVLVEGHVLLEQEADSGMDEFLTMKHEVTEPISVEDSEKCLAVATISDVQSEDGRETCEKQEEVLQHEETQKQIKEIEEIDIKNKEQKARESSKIGEFEEKKRNEEKYEKTKQKEQLNDDEVDHVKKDIASENQKEEELKKKEVGKRKQEEAETLKIEEPEQKQKEEEALQKKAEAYHLEEEEAGLFKKNEVDEKQQKEEEQLKKDISEKKKKEKEELKKEEAKVKKDEAEQQENEEFEKKQQGTEVLKEEEEVETLKIEKEETLTNVKFEQKQTEEAADKKKEEQQIKEDEEESLKRKEEKKQKEEDGAKSKEEEERIKKEEADRLKKEQNERKQKVEEALKQKEEKVKRKQKEEALKEEEEERLRKEESERKKKEEDEIRNIEKEERIMKEEADRLKKEEDERKQREEDEIRNREEEEQIQKEEADRFKNEEDERKQREEEALKQKEEEEDRSRKEETARKKKEEEEIRNREEEERIKKEEADRLKNEEAERKQKEEEALQQKEEEEDPLRKEETARKKKEEEELRNREEEERLKKEEANCLKKEEAERKQKEEAALKKKEEEEEQLRKEKSEREKKKEEELRNREEEERIKREEVDRLKQEENERKQTEEEVLKQKKKEEDRLRREETARKEKEEEEVMNRQEEERIKKEEADRLKKEEAEMKQKEEEALKKKEEGEDRLRKEETDRKKKEEEELRNREEEERLKKEEADCLKREEDERKQKEEEALKQKEEEEDRLRRKETARKEKEEEEVMNRQEEERIKKEEADRLKKEEAEMKQKEEEALKKKEEGEDRLRKEETKRKKKEEEELRNREEEERIKREEIDRLKKEEDEREKKEEEALKQKEEKEDRLRREETARKKKEEEEIRNREEEERINKEEADRLKKEEFNRKREEEEALKKKEEEEDRLRKEETDRKKKEEEEFRNREQEERLKKEEADCLKKEEDERKQKEEQALKQKEEDEERLRREETARKKKEEEEIRNREEEERIKKEEADRLKKDEFNRKRAEEEEALKKKEEEEDRLRKEETERKKKEEKELRNREEEERIKREEIDRLKKEEDERKQKDKEALKKKKDEERLNEEAERFKNEETGRKQKEEDLKKKEEAERLKVDVGEQKKKQEDKIRSKKEEKEQVKKLEVTLMKNEEGPKQKEIEDEVKNEEEQKKKRRKASLKKGEEAQKKKDGNRKDKDGEKIKRKESLKKDGRESSNMKENVAEVKSHTLEESVLLKNKESDIITNDENEKLKEEGERLSKKKQTAEQTDEDGRENGGSRRSSVRKLSTEKINTLKKGKTENERESSRETRRKGSMDRYANKDDVSQYRNKQYEIEKEGEMEDYSQVRYNKTKIRPDIERTPVYREPIKQTGSQSDDSSYTDSSSLSIAYKTDDRSFRDRSKRDQIRYPKSDVSFSDSSSKTTLTNYPEYVATISSRNRSNDYSFTSSTFKAPQRSIKSYDRYCDRSRKSYESSFSSFLRPDSRSTLISPSVNYSKRILGRRSPTLIPDIDTSAYYLSSSRSRTSDISHVDRIKCPFFCTKLTNRTVSEGSQIRLTSTVIGQPDPEVHWTKNGEKLQSGGRERMKLENGLATLEISAALPEDSGYYACVATNSHGQSSSEAIVRVYAAFEAIPLPPTFTSSIKDTYRFTDHELVLECKVRGHPTPSITWLKDDIVLRGDRYKQSFLGDGVCRLQIADPDIADSGEYSCRADNDVRTDQIRHVVHFEGHEHRFASTRERILFDDRNRTTCREIGRRPRFSSYLIDHSVPAGGTIALQVEVRGSPTPEVTWLRRDGVKNERISNSKVRTFAESGVHTLILLEASESEAGTYICRAINAFGQIDTSANVEVIIPGKFSANGKPAMFISRPVDKIITAVVGEDVSVSFRISGIPKPRVTWMKGIRDITDGPRSHKETLDDYVRITLSRMIPSDEGTYCILAKNRYGCDRAFFTIKVKQRARSLTPTILSDTANRLADMENEEMRIHIKDVPGPISSEPIVIDGGTNWLSLSWGKAEQRGPAPVVAYKIDAWLLGGEGGARWVELGISPINSFDAFNLRPRGEYKFRITPRNRYGWGESLSSTDSFTVSDVVDIPEFLKILPGQLKALEGTNVKLECEVRGDSKIDVRWYRENTGIDPNDDPRCTVYYNGFKCSLTLNNIKEYDTGRYICEASSKAGKVSTFARVFVVTDPKILKADEQLRSRYFEDATVEGPPQFTMRLRDRRVQATYPVRLTCQVLGYPEPEVVWFKNGREICADGFHAFWNDESHFHTLEISSSSLEDSGRYMATAKNVNGSVSCRCILVVDKGIRAYIAPEFLCGLDAAYTVKLGGELRMCAQIEAYPSVGVVWHRDGVRLRPSRRAVMTLNHDGAVELSLANVTNRDAGVYSCTATNEVGRAETSTRIAILGPDEQSSFEKLSPHVVVDPPSDPKIPYSQKPLFITKPLSTEAVEGDTVIILCEVVGDPKPEVMWLRDFLKPDYYRDAAHFRRIGAGPQYRLEIPFAKLDFTGTYSVIAKNSHGEAKAIISLQIYAKGQGKGDTMEQQSSVRHGKVLSLPIIRKELRDLRCCDGDAVSLECKVYAPTEQPNIRWEKEGKTLHLSGDFSAEFDGEIARLSIQHVFPEDEGEYTCIASNQLGKAYTSACLIVDVPEGKENVLSQPRLTRPMGLLSAGSTPRSTPRSTPVRSLSPAVARGRELKAISLPRRVEAGGSMRKRPKVTPPKFYTVPHNRVAEEGETVRFQCAITGHPMPWVVWDKDGTAVTPTARISIKEKDDLRVLEITEVTSEDVGLYRVTLENDVGRTEATARLEIINRHSLVPRPVRITRSASPRTYPTFTRSVLGCATRVDRRFQLQCDIKSSPSPTPSWYRNGKRIERSNRIRKCFDGRTAKIEISEVKESDAGEYVCEATNLLGSTRSSCQVIVLEADDPSTLDEEAPMFLQTLPKESIVMEGHSYELQTRITGSPPFEIKWLKDKKEVSDTDCYRYVVYEDGGVALRLANVNPLAAGEYTCLVRNAFGESSCNGFFSVQDYKGASKAAFWFTKTPVPVLASKGETISFCARIHSERPIEIDWSVNGKSARENYRCKVEKDGPTSILRINSVTYRDCGEIRCTASVTGGRGPSISCATDLRFMRFSGVRDRSLSPTKKMTLSPVVKRSTRISTSPYRQEDKENVNGVPTVSHKADDINSFKKSEFSHRLLNPRADIFSLKMSSQKKNQNEGNAEIQRENSNTNGSLRIENQNEIKTEERNERDIKAEKDMDKKIGNLVESRMKNGSSIHHNINLKSMDGKFSLELVEPEIPKEIKPFSLSSDFKVKIGMECLDEHDHKEPAVVLQAPADVFALRGSTVILSVSYRGHPEPRVRWLQAGRALIPGEKIRIKIEKGASSLTLENITADQAGKYAVFVENVVGQDCRYSSVAVEGPPERPAGTPIVSSCNVGSVSPSVNVAWCSPPYDGGCALTGYSIEMRQVNEESWTLVAETYHSLSHTVTGLVPEQTYLFRVRAINIHGASEPSIESDPFTVGRKMEKFDEERRFQVSNKEEEECFEKSIEDTIVTPEDGKLFAERYDVHEELGKGRYGIVKRVIEKATERILAAKFVRTIKATDRKQVHEEMKIMNMLRHPKLLRLSAAFENPREIIMVTEYISGGELFERVVADDFTLTEKDSILFMRQICEGVKYMHKNSVVHLDLKPENIMCRTRTSHSIKLIDFGLAQVLDPNVPIRVLFGTPEFIPPEIISYEPIGTESDMWSVGVICYVLLSGLSPFMGNNDTETFANITRAEYDFDDEAFDAISQEAKDFIGCLLIKRKDCRMSAKECLEHSWLAQHTENMSRVALSTEKLKKFLVRRKWQKTGNALRALGRMSKSANSRRSPSLTASSPVLKETSSFDSSQDDQNSGTRENSFDEVTSVDVASSSFIEKISDWKEDNLKEKTIEEVYKNPKEILLEETCLIGQSHPEETIEVLSSSVGEDNGLTVVDFHSKRISHLKIGDDEGKILDVSLDSKQDLSEENDKVESQTDKTDDTRDSTTKKYKYTKISQIRLSVNFKEPEFQSITQECDNNLDLDTGNVPSKTEDNKDIRSETKEEIALNPSEDVGFQSEVCNTVCDSNLLLEAVDGEGTRIIQSSQGRHYLHTGNVSRTAKMFETKQAETSAGNAPEEKPAPLRRLSSGLPVTRTKTQNDRIQKAFAFWNK
ncbi:titin homolog isoform X2 [Belonocnema kinseyi]|uniref:titin homolog isoform X2 n=1 Tax=Belonocnema kinseyi TaxID=2817044 RepID=UPI00143D5B6E|nr:titin homolog isoform X2 [Belonocnema kinseyi]